ncbi:hypothetical protein [Streptomyces sp. NBC_01304]|uniref:hypothetical protein n=1 Tax=Streptomyces sp. NBC_01304 TaxID=2903818 RepID=UPI002E1234B7|nr:hypothetical protein OG430_48215 [Streptomyces sp. NBC_01304]
MGLLLALVLMCAPVAYLVYWQYKELGLIATIAVHVLIISLLRLLTIWSQARRRARS